VVLRPGAAPRSEPLVRALERRAMRVSTTDSRHEALAVACVAHRSREPLALVLDRADELKDLDRTLESIERFAPGALVWVFDESANPPLRAFVPPTSGADRTPEHEQSPIAPSARPKPGASATPNLRLTGAEPDEPISSADILDQDELDALLGPDEV